MSGENMDEHAGVVWARIEGKIDLMNERHSNATRAIEGLAIRVQGHADKLDRLEAEGHISRGEKIGFDKAVKGIYALSAAASLGSLAAIAKVFNIGG